MHERRAALAVLGVVLVALIDQATPFTGIWQERSPSPRCPGIFCRNSAEPRRRLRPADPAVEQVTKLFFQKAKGYQEKTQTARFQVASSVSAVAEMYASLLLQRLHQKPGSRSVILVPRLGRGREILRVLEEHGLKASLLSHESAQSSPYDSVLVCLFGSIHVLAGCRFDVKIIDEAHFLQRSTKTKAKVEGIPAGLVGEFSFDFGTEEVDYKYSMQQALAADQLRSRFECFGLPIATGGPRSRAVAARRRLLAQWIQRQQHNWPGSRAMVVHHRKQAANEFAETLRALGVEAGDSDLKAVSGSKEVLCVAKGSSADFALPGVQTVILAEPTRQPSSLKYLQHLLQNGWKDEFHRARVLIEVLDGNGRDETVQNRIKTYSNHLSAPLQPQLLDFRGRSFEMSPSNVQYLLQAQGRMDVPSWLESLYIWLLEHRRKPRSHAADPEESRQAERLTRGYRYMRQKEFNQTSAALFSACIDLLGPRPWLQDLSRWMRDMARPPVSRASEAEERKQSRRWYAARRYLELGQLNAAEKQLVESWVDDPPLDGSTSQMTREWMQSLHAWLRSHSRKPHRNASDPEERLQAVRWNKAASHAKKGKLNKEEERLFHQCKDIIAEIVKADKDAKIREWLRSLHAWLTSHGKKPHWNATDPEEKLQNYRLKMGRKLLKTGKLTAPEQGLFRCCTDVLQQSPG